MAGGGGRGRPGAGRRTAYATPVPVAIGEPGPATRCRGRCRAGSRERRRPRTTPSGSVAFGHDLADFITGVRAIDTRGRTFARAGRGGDPRASTPGWRSASSAVPTWSTSPAPPIWTRLRDLPRTSADVMTHGDLTPGNVLVTAASRGGHRCRWPRARRSGAGPRRRLASASGQPARSSRGPGQRRHRVGSRPGLGVRTGHGGGLVLRRKQPGHASDGPNHAATHPGLIRCDGASRSSLADLRRGGPGARCRGPDLGGRRLGAIVVPRGVRRIMLPGLTAPVEVLRDGYGVPQIYADTAEDLFLAQGYMHAQDRFYEMDFRRHVAAGRLPSSSAPARCRPMRTSAPSAGDGWPSRSWRCSRPRPGARRSRAAAGVNAYLGDRSAAELSLEYRLLGLQGLDYTPELDRRRLGLLAQGDGLGPGLQPQPGGRAGAGHCRIRGRPRGQPVPRLPAGEPRPDRRTRHRGGREVRPDSKADLPPPGTLRRRTAGHKPYDVNR